MTDTGIASGAHASALEEEDPGAVLGRLAHELRTPLNVVLGHAQLVQLEEAAGPAPRESIEEILKAGRALARIVDELENYVTVGLAGTGIPTAAAPLGPILEEAVQEIEVAEGVRILLEGPTEVAALAWVQTDRAQLRRCFARILATALRFDEQRGNLLVNVHEADEGLVRIEVMPERISAQARSSRLQQAETTGARRVWEELLPVTHILRLLGVDIQVFATPQGGYHFRVGVPQAAAPGAHAGSSPPGPTPASAPQGSSRLKTILYVEDNAANQRLMEGLIATLQDLRLIVCDTAAEALAAVAIQVPDLVLLDIGLPGRSGLDLVAELRGLPGLDTVPVLAISANAMSGDVQTALAAGFDAYIVKPIDVPTVRDLLRKRLAP